MDATRSAVERELQRIRSCLDSTRSRIAQHKDGIRKAAEGDFDSGIVALKASWMKQGERDQLQYRFVEKILAGILDRTKDPPSVKRDDLIEEIHRLQNVIDDALEALGRVVVDAGAYSTAWRPSEFHNAVGILKAGRNGDK